MRGAVRGNAQYLFCDFLNKYFGGPGAVLGSEKVLEEGVKDEQDIA